MYLFNYSFNSPLNCFISIFEISFVNFVNFFLDSALRTPRFRNSRRPLQKKPQNLP